MNQKNRGIVALLAGLITLVMVVISFISVRLFFGGNEDSWVCIQGDWVAHGSPSATKPIEPCGQ